jgi:formyl-CoA transferase
LIAAAFVVVHFGDLGAEVIKVEKFDGGDDARHMGPAFHNGDALNFHLFNRGKKSVALDLKSTEGFNVSTPYWRQPAFLIQKPPG